MSNSKTNMKSWLVSRSRYLAVVVLALCSSGQVAVAENAKPQAHAIASAHYLATEAGMEVFAAGGNAFDAAVAVSSTLAVVEPASSGLGGGGLWLLHRAQDNFDVMIDGREMAPGAADRNMYLGADGEVNRDLAVNGPLAAGIPGEAAGFVHLARHYGRLPLAESLAPAIRLAKNGFPVDEKYRALMTNRAAVVNRYPAASAIFLVDGQVPPLGHVIKQPDLARVLESIATHGHDGFYKGPIAQKLVAGVREAGGIWTLDDLARYKVVEREPVRTSYKGYKLVTASPPSSGGIALATMLNILNPYPLSTMTEAERTHLVIESMRRAYRDRTLYLGDSDFVDVPIQRLTHPFYADGLRAGIRHDRATPSEMLPGIESEPGGTDTSHFSLIDTEGNMVAGTLTVNLPYGSGFVAPGMGFFLNNEMDDFSAKKGSPNAYGLLGAEANAIVPYKRPLSSMTPTIVHGDDQVAILGTPGGSRIITMVLLGILEFVDGKSPQDWVSRPRYHHQYMPDQVTYEPGTFDAETLATLESMGHEVKDRGRTWGNMHGVRWNVLTGEVDAASDPRWTSGRSMVEVP